jgi:hypothetical protein
MSHPGVGCTTEARKGVSYFAQTPLGNERMLDLIERQLKAAGPSIRPAKLGTHPGVRGLAPKLEHAR